MKTAKNSIAQSVAALLEATKNEITEFRKELGQEKAGVEVKYTELRNELTLAIKDLRDLLNLNAYVTRETAISLSEKLTALENQITSASENATTDLKSHLFVIKQEIIGIINDLDKEKDYNEMVQRIKDNMHRFKIKLEILKLKAELGKMEVKDWVRDTKQSVNAKIKTIRDFPLRAEDKVKKTWVAFKGEVDEVYADLYNTFTK